jgi:response regulator of citrate/malate metabolism
VTYRVLVVEDEPLVGEANVAYLNRLGLEVVGVARTRQEAVRILGGDDAIDLVLLDMQLPDGHGLSLLRSIRGTGRPIDVIAVTAARDVDVVRQAVAQGVVAYLIKPFTFAAFRDKVEQYLDYRRGLATQSETVGQTEVDAMLASLRPTLGAQSLPKGLTIGTLEQVSQVVRTQGPVSAAEAGLALATSRVTARRYLEYLTESGLVRRTNRHGTSGRPEVEYRWR